MVSNRSKNLIAASLSAASAATSWADTTAPIPANGNGTSSAEVAFATAGTGSLHEQWLKVPMRCKDRSISASPVVVTDETQSAVAANVHAVTGR
jgi:hypothetical protein